MYSLPASYVHFQEHRDNPEGPFGASALPFQPRIS